MFQFFDEEQWGNIHPHCWKERPKIRILTKFQCGKSNSKFTAQSRDLDDGEYHKTSLQSYIFVSFQQTTLLTKLSTFTDFIAFFPAVLTEFSLTGLSQKLKKPRRVFYSQVKRVFQ